RTGGVDHIGPTTERMHEDPYFVLQPASAVERIHEDPYFDLCPALFADRIHVDGNVELGDGLQVVGTIRMVNAYIGGSFRVARAEISAITERNRLQHDRAIHLDGSHIN